MRTKKLFIKSKCDFLMDKLLFHGYVISSDGIMVDPNKVKVITSWWTL
jgi:hypothetical protein